MKIDTLNSEYAKELNQIKQFLLTSGFTNTTLEVLDALAKLILKSTHEINLVMGQEYTALTENKTKGDTVRIRISYYINKNYKKVRDYIIITYCYDIGKFYSGVKNFVEQIAIVYSVLVNN